MMKLILSKKCLHMKHMHKFQSKVEISKPVGDHKTLHLLGQSELNRIDGIPSPLAIHTEIGNWIQMNAIRLTNLDYCSCNKRLHRRWFLVYVFEDEEDLIKCKLKFPHYHQQVGGW